MTWLFVVLGCDRPEPEPVTAAPSDETRLVTVQQEIRRPDGRRYIQVSRHVELPVDGYAELPDEQRDVAFQVLNTVTGPCAPCMDEGITLADCFLEPPADCETVAQVAQRVVRKAGEGSDKVEVLEAVEYADGWYPVAQESQGLDFAVWIDDSDMGVQAEARFAELEAACPGVLTRRDLESAGEHVRAVPTVFINGYRLRGLQSLDAYVRLVDMELADQGASCPR
ncbi:MAG: hypothetical protein GY913_13645 [Proteobacteria bacterium]|nr:hypothetical protein [Pseudomonadota bacterium]MCP4917951.1 hypothetical protein [Pseudomonadota bacterium]